MFINPLYLLVSVCFKYIKEEVSHNRFIELTFTALYVRFEHDKQKSSIENLHDMFMTRIILAKVFFLNGIMLAFDC